MTGMILLIDDDITHQMMVTALLKKMGYNTAYASNGKDALHFIENKGRKFIELMLLDLNMPNMDGLEVLEIVKQKYPDIPVIMLTGSTDIKNAVTAMKLGAANFINKPVYPEHLKISIKNALQFNSLNKEITRLKRKEEKITKFSDIIGEYGGLAKIINISRRAANSDIPVFINGEIGVGKGLLSSAIHGESNRSGKPFIEVNCASIPNDMVEGELFGRDNVIGKFQEADGGTISLYEVSELPPPAQAKLLKLLRQKEIIPIGSTKAIPVDVRVISSSSKNLPEEVKLNNFREDLYFRLNVLNITIPPLRERSEDILPLIQHFTRQFSISENLPKMSISAQAEKFLSSYVWKGNVRELENVIHRAMLLSDKYIMDVKDFTYALSHMEEVENKGNYKPNANNPYNISMITAEGKLKTAGNIEQEAIYIALQHHKNNVTQAAKSLGIAKSTFYKKMNKINRNQPLQHH